MSKPSYSPEGSPLNQESDINDFILKNSILAYNGINEALVNLEDKLKEGTRMSRREALTLLVTSFAVLLAACGPIQATEPTEVINDSTATSEIVSSETEVLNDPTVTSEVMPSEEEVIISTTEVASTQTPESTPTNDSPELSTVRPTQLFAEFVPEDSPLRAEFFELMRTQFEDGGLKKSASHTYTLACIASKDIHYHTPHINLGDDYVVTHSIPCQYYDAQGQEQIVYIPAIIFNLEKDLYQFIGRKPVIGEDAKNLFDGYTGHFSDTGPVNIIKRGQGYIGKGHPITLNFSRNPEGNFSVPESLQGSFITSDDLTNFSLDGNPEHLPEQLIWCRATGFISNNFPKEPLE